LLSKSSHLWQIISKNQKATSEKSKAAL